MLRKQQRLSYISLLILLTGLISPLLAVAPLRAAGAVGDGTPASCTGQALAAAVAGGGAITFNCGPNPQTIVVEAMVIADGQRVTLDGGNRITLSGGDATRIFTVAAGGALTLNQIVLSHGYVVGSGGAIWNQGTLTLNDTTIGDSQASGPDAMGGAILNDNGLLFMNGGAVRSNQAATAGGLANVKGTAVLDGTLIDGNTAQAYSGLSNNGTLSLLNSIVRNNVATDVSGYGGGLGHLNGSLNVVNSTVVSNSAQLYFGGGIAVMAGDATIEHSAILSNTSGLGGGGLYVHPNADAQVIVRDSRIEYNSTLSGDSNVFGGGVYNGKQLTLERVIVSHNQSSSGGGLFNATNASSLTLRAATFSQNSASGFGGGLWLSGSQVPHLTNVTVSANSASAGGGLYQSGIGTDLLNVTLYNNSAANGANLYNANTIPSLRNTILAAPTGSANCGFGNGAPPLSSNGHNLASDNSCSLAANTDQQNLDPLLGSLADNGSFSSGLTLLTHLPQAGSPAIDAGDAASCPASDQRGYLRPAGSGCDIGAIESGALPPEPGPLPEPSPTITATPLALPPATLPDPNAPEWPAVHPIIDNAVKVAISLTPAHGLPETRVTVGGQAPAGTTEVRISSLHNGQTIGESIAPVTDGSYSFDFVIPPDTAAGVVDLCASVVGSADTELVCAPLQIDAPPLIDVAGTLPTGVSLLGDATLRLQAINGGAEYVTKIGAGGSFALAGVPAGQYESSVAGQLSKPIASQVVALPYDNQSVTINLTPLDRCAQLEQVIPIGYMTASPSRAGAQDPFGIYVHNVKNEVTFEAFPQANGPIQSVRFEVQDRDRKIIAAAVDDQAPWSIKFNVGDLPASIGSRHATIYATPMIAGQPGCTVIHEIAVIDSVFAKAPFQPGAVTWDNAARLYRIQAVLPSIDNILPAEFELPPSVLPPLPYLGRYDNRLNTGIQVVGSLDLNGYVRLNVISAILEAKLLDHVLLSQNSDLPLLRLDPNQALFYKDINQLDLPFNTCQLVPGVGGFCADHPFYLSLPMINIPVLTFFGIVDVTVNGSAGIGGSLSIDGHIRPLAPALVATLRPTGNAHAEIGVGVRLLMGLAEAGASSRVDAEIGTPLTISADTNGAGAKLEACLRMTFSVSAYAEAFYGLKEWKDTQVLFTFPDNGDPNCVTLIETAASKPEVDPSVPAVIAAPAIAIAPDGTQLSAYVENTTVGDDTPHVQILARFQAPAAATWGDPIPLSNPAHSVSSPVVAFVGPDHTPLVAWVENTLSADEAAALGEDLNAHLLRQEIVYRMWDGTAWSATTFLTHDLLGDGLPALAGSEDGAVLAWTRDLDGDIGSRDDQRIAVSLFDPNSNEFGPVALLTAPGGGLNGDVQVAYDESVAPASPYLVWINDADAMLVSADDRTLAVATQVDNDWVILESHSLPARVDSPTISVGADGVHLAFLVREASPDGNVGLIGTNGMLWTAALSGDQWRAEALPGENETPVYGERPVLATQGAQTLLLFRRFAPTVDNSSLGQIALSQLDTQAKFATPLYLTDDPYQNWQPALAINPLTGAAAILKVARTTAVVSTAQTKIGTSQTVLAAPTTTLSNQGDAVETLTVAANADPSLDPLTVSTTNPAPNQIVTVTVTVRNVGLRVTDGVSVALYKGEPGNGVLVSTAGPSGVLSFNETYTLQVPLLATGGEEPIYAEITTTGQNGKTDNDRATYRLGQLAAPIVGWIGESSEYPNALTVAWVTPPNHYVSGYRILRGPTVDGPFAVVGESSSALFTDSLVERGHSNCYVAQAFNTNTLSARSAAVCSTLPLLTTHLPLIGH